MSAMSLLCSHAAQTVAPMPVGFSFIQAKLRNSFHFPAFRALLVFNLYVLYFSP